MAAGGPASTIGFSLARDYNGRSAVGTATGVVNVGGFSATILASLLVGGILDLACHSDVPAYRLAFGGAVAVQLFGMVMAVRWWLRVRGLLLRAQSRGEPVPVRVVRRQFDRVAPGASPGRSGDRRASAGPAGSPRGPRARGPRARQAARRPAGRVSSRGRRTL